MMNVPPRCSAINCARDFDFAGASEPVVFATPVPAAATATVSAIKIARGNLKRCIVLLRLDRDGRSYGRPVWTVKLLLIRRDRGKRWRAARYRGAAALGFARTAHAGAHAVNRRHVVEHLSSIGSAPARARTVGLSWSPGAGCSSHAARADIV
jgi:hypothetical protein